MTYKSNILLPGDIVEQDYFGEQRKVRILNVQDVYGNGRLDEGISPSLKAEMFLSLDHGESGIDTNALDISRFRYVNASGLSVVLVSNRLNRGSYNNNSIALITDNDAVLRLLQISQLDTILNVYENIDKLKLNEEFDFDLLRPGSGRG